MAESFQIPLMPTPASGVSTYGMDQAVIITDDIKDFVLGRITDGVSDAAEMQAAAVAVIEELKDLPATITLPALPTAPPMGFDFEFTDSDITPVAVGDFGEITFGTVTPPTLDDVDAGDPIIVPSFTPTALNIDIPDAPDLGTLPTAPTAPTLPDIELPTAPTLSFPAVPTLTTLTLPTFNVEVLDEVAPTTPEFAGGSISAVYNWSEPSYATERIEDIEAKLAEIWEGGIGLPVAVENAMWERAQEREDLQTERDVGNVLADFATRGFFTPSGAFVKKVTDIRNDASRRKNTLNRDITIEVAKIHVENARFAVTQGIATENMYFNIHTNMVQRMFEIEKARVEQLVSVYNAQVNLFNGKISMYRTAVEANNNKIRSYIDVYKAQLDGAIASGKMDELKVSVYTAQLQGVQAIMGVYEAEVRAANVAAQTVATKIDGYKAQIQAYAATLDASKVPLELYKAQVQAEVSKTALLDAEAKGYAALISGKTAQASIITEQMRAATAKNDSLLKQYEAHIDHEKAKMLTQVNVIQSGVDAYKADVGRYEAEIRRDTALADAKLRAEEANLRLGIASYEAQMGAYRSTTDIILKQADINLEAIKSAGDIASTLAAGALAGVHVGASLSGAGSVSASGGSSHSQSLTFSQSTADNRSFE